ncbi:MAG: hypothetical protein PHP30_09320 [Bacteroidales bacterium]|nr:hypothetical protein [Bacteroidales bacterium]MDD2426113.1 hypothetical protein [Bacteroidales bacterium]MDD3990277.1 hypothetical protein [Bacteroidales bacterium]MDD4639695.1 hypothetical protein [Bacteroidales bacterium]
MKKEIIITTLIMLAALVSCNPSRQDASSPERGVIGEDVINLTVKEITDKFASVQAPDLLNAGVQQVAMQWRESDGTSEEFKTFCMENFAPTPEEKEKLFIKLSVALESVYGGFNKMSVDLKKPLHLDGDPLAGIDYILGAYDPSSHFTDDMYNNKMAYITILNFPFYTLDQKEELGANWSRLEWAYARMGDIFIPRPPAEVQQLVADAEMKAESYISEYNIMMGHLVTAEGKKLFPADMKLLSHWNLRDELKSNYAPGPDNFEKQKMIYKVMLHIIEQTIPSQVINNPEYDWDPWSNTLYKAGEKVEATPEGAKRYEILLGQFKARQEVDKYSPLFPTALKRAYEGGMQIREEEIEKMFIEFISSPKVKKVASIISERLGRKLEPFDIWYDGFKSRSSLPEDKLTAQTNSLYPTAEAYDKDIPNMLVKLGFTKDKAEKLGEAIVVEAARGSGHAWGAMSRDDVARLRTRLTKKGMDYKGFNIAVHEMGHNVEQTISMRDVDYYILNGVPNTAFTEANAFVFQKRDLSLLGYNLNDPEKEKMSDLDIFWGAYEIMGVALVDMNVWRWMYNYPDETPEKLKMAVVNIAQNIWNQYYAPVLGETNSPLLAIYSHMLNSPLYLANYPLGHIIEYQLEKYYAGKNLAEEIQRIYSIGNITPSQWMKQAVGEGISTAAMLQE